MADQANRGFVTGPPMDQILKLEPRNSHKKHKGFRTSRRRLAQALTDQPEAIKSQAAVPAAIRDSKGDKYPLKDSRLGLAKVPGTTLWADEVFHLALSARSPDFEKKTIGVRHAPVGPWLYADSSALRSVSAAAGQKIRGTSRKK